VLSKEKGCRGIAAVGEGGGEKRGERRCPRLGTDHRVLEYTLSRERPPTSLSKGRNGRSHQKKKKLTEDGERSSEADPRGEEERNAKRRPGNLVFKQEVPRHRDCSCPRKSISAKA